MAKQVNSALIGKAIIARIDKAGVFHGILDYKDADITRMTDVPAQEYDTAGGDEYGRVG